jgi:hypothetical protein
MVHHVGLTAGRAPAAFVPRAGDLPLTAKSVVPRPSAPSGTCEDSRTWVPDLLVQKLHCNTLPR